MQGRSRAQQAVAAAVREAMGGLDVLFINAGIGYFRPLAELEEAGFDRSIAVNLKGPLF